MAEPALHRSPLARTETRCLASVYLAFAAATALVALALRGSWAPFATLALLPVFALAVIEAAQRTSALWRDWRAHELAVNVRRVLSRLRPVYRVVARGSTSAARDRHVAIGPNGVFLILSSDDGGRVTASGQRLFVNARLPWRNLVEDCRIEALRVAERVRRALGRPVPVHAVLCFTRALVAVGQEIRGVKIVQMPRLTRLIESVAPAVTLGEQEIEAVRAALVAATTEPERKVLRLTPRRAAVPAERSLTLVGRPPRPHRNLP